MMTTMPSPPQTATYHHHMSLYTPTHQADGQARSSFSPPEPYFAAGMTAQSSPSPASLEVTPRHLHSRTRKRIKDDRPDEEVVGMNTINLLFRAQKELRSHETLTNGTIGDKSSCGSHFSLGAKTGVYTPEASIPDYDMTMDDQEEPMDADMDNAMIQEAPHSAFDDRCHQSSLQFPILTPQNTFNHINLPATTLTTLNTNTYIPGGAVQPPQPISLSPSSSETSPLSQPKSLQQKTLHSFFGGAVGGGKRGISINGNNNGHGNGTENRPWTAPHQYEKDVDMGMGMREEDGRKWVGGIGWM